MRLEGGPGQSGRQAVKVGDFEDDCIYGYLDRNDYIETLRSIDWTDVRHDFQYSNIGAIILGIVMERASGVSYESMMERFIMEELSLSHTWLDIPSEFPAGYQLARPCGTDQTEKNTGYGIIGSEWPPAVFTPHWRILLPMRRHT